MDADEHESENLLVNFIGKKMRLGLLGRGLLFRRRDWSDLLLRWGSGFVRRWLFRRGRRRRCNVEGFGRHAAGAEQKTLAPHGHFDRAGRGLVVKLERGRNVVTQ